MKKALLILVLLLCFVSVKADEKIYSIDESFIYEKPKVSFEGTFNDYDLNIKVLNLSSNVDCIFRAYFFTDAEGQQLVQYYEYEHVFMVEDTSATIPKTKIRESSYYKVETNCSNYYGPIKNNTSSDDEYYRDVVTNEALIPFFSVWLFGFILFAFIMVVVIKFVFTFNKKVLTDEKFRNIMMNHQFDIKDITSEYEGVNIALKAVNYQNVEMIYFSLDNYVLASQLVQDEMTKFKNGLTVNYFTQINGNGGYIYTATLDNKFIYFRKQPSALLVVKCDAAIKKEIKKIIKELYK